MQPPPELFIKRFLRLFRELCDADGRLTLFGDIANVFVKRGFESRQLLMLVKLLQVNNLMRCSVGSQTSQMWHLNKNVEEICSFPGCIVVYMKGGKRIQCDW